MCSKTKISLSTISLHERLLECKNECNSVYFVANSNTCLQVILQQSFYLNIKYYDIKYGCNYFIHDTFILFEHKHFTRIS